MKKKYIKFKKSKNEPLTLNNIGRIHAAPSGIHLTVERSKLDSLTDSDKDKFIKEVKCNGIILHITEN